MKSILALLCCILIGTAHAAPADDAKATAKGALKFFNHLVTGKWRGTGEPEGTRAEKQRGFWIENVYWKWEFSKDDAWITMKVEKGKHVDGGELRYLPKQKKYQLSLTTADNKTLVFVGALESKKLVLNREDPKTKELQRLVFTFLRDNRYLYRYEVKAANRTRFKKQYQVGVTDTSEPFAFKGDSSPECIVSGGKGTRAIEHEGKTYYVCCSGCAAEFKANPVKYVQELEARKAKDKK